MKLTSEEHAGHLSDEDVQQILEQHRKGEPIQLVLRSACVIIAVGKLLNNPDWAPLEVALKVLQHNGLPSEETKGLEQYAPIRVWNEKSQVSGDGNTVTIPNADGSERVVVAANTPLVVMYKTGPTTSHAVCIPARHMFAFKKKVCCIITKDEAR